MKSTHFLRHVKSMRMTPNYLFLATLYGISTLIIPFAVQILVNNLALAGLWTSTFAYLTVIALTLAAAMVIKYFQLVLVEFMQRHIFFRQLAKWQRKTPEEDIQSPYFFEIFAMMKTFASLITEGSDLLLRIIFGSLALLFIHPAFIAIHILLLLSFVVLRMQGRGAIGASLHESDSKYRIYDEVERHNWRKNQILAADYLLKRDVHFRFIRHQAVTIFATYVILPNHDSVEVLGCFDPKKRCLFSKTSVSGE